jgi:hypothetical protein
MSNKLLNQYFIFAGVHSPIPEESDEMIKNDLKVKTESKIIRTSERTSRWFP